MSRTLRTDLLVIVAGLTELAMGLVFFSVPGQFATSNYPVVKHVMVVMAPLFMTAGIGLLYTASYPGIPSRFVTVIQAVAGLPFATLAVNFAVARVWTGIISYSILTTALLLAPWAMRRQAATGGAEPRPREVDLFAVALGLMQMAIGIGFLLAPGTFPAKSYAVVKDFLPVLGAAMVLAAGLLLRSELASPQPGWRPLSRILAALPFLVLAYNFFVIEVWTGVALYGLFAATALVSIFWKGLQGEETTPPFEDGIARLNPYVVRTVETGTWLLTLLLVGLFALEPIVAMGHLKQVAMGVMFLAIFNLSWFRLARRLLTRELAVLIHLGVLTASFGYLMFVTGGLYSYFTSLLLIPVFMAALTLMPSAPWLTGSIAFTALLIDSIRDLSISSVRGIQVVSLVLLHTMPLMVGTGVSWIIARQMRRYVEALCVAKEEMEIKNTLLQEMALQDPVTGLFNHRYFQERLEEELRRAVRSDRPMALAIFDLDNFKKVNDTYGHLAGDAVLQQVARAMKQRLRANDVLARYGGEEFAVILPETDLDTAWTIMDRVREEVAAMDIRLPDGHTDIRVSFSAGVTEFEGHKPNRQALVAEADQALYKAKAGGRNRVERAGRMVTPGLAGA